MPKITEVKINGLEETIFRSGYPFLKSAPTQQEFDSGVAEIREAIKQGDLENRHIKRVCGLAKAKGGGHDQFLTGISVDFDLTFANKAWEDIKRYKFLNFISSMSQMHRIHALDVRAHCNQYVDPRAIDILIEKQEGYNNAEQADKAKAFLPLIYNIPSGFELMSSMTTNYRCLKNIYEQRRTHRLVDFQVFCDWIETLPLAQELIVSPAKKKQSHLKDGIREKAITLLDNIGAEPELLLDISDDELFKFFSEAMGDAV